MDTFLANILKNKQTCIFLSPHLDDAMLSAGSLIHYLSDKTKVIVINVFTESSDTRQTLSALKFVRDMGYQKPSILFKARRDEDIQAFSEMGIQPINLGFHDALWRKKEGVLWRAFGRVLPEFQHVYPTYRFHMNKGVVAKPDNKTMYSIIQKLEKIVNEIDSPMIFCPLGVGNHVDHILVRKISERMFKNNLTYWSDFPYNHREKNEGIAPTGFKKEVYVPNMAHKKKLIEQYKTQVAGLFPNGIIPDQNEIFFIKK